MAARKRPTATTPTAETITINDALLQTGENETAFRLALSYIRPDDFDTVKAISVLDFEATCKQLQASQGQLPSSPPAITEEAPQSEAETASETPTAEQQDSKGEMVSASQSQRMTTPPPQQIEQAEIDPFDEMVAIAQRKVDVAAAVHHLANQTILRNIQSSDQQLVEALRNNWNDKKQGYFEGLKSLQNSVVPAPSLPGSDFGFQKELDEILGELESNLGN